MKKINSLEDYFAPGGLLAKALPDYEHRQSQQDMAFAVAEALLKKKILIAEAGTGTGKTLAYLIPAILSGDKIVVSTRTKTLQEQLVKKDIPLIQKTLPIKFSFAVMKGRANYLCLKRFLSFNLEGLFKEPNDVYLFQKIKKWLKKTGSGDREELEFIAEDSPIWREVCSKSETCIGNKCQYFESCFVYKMRAKAANSDIIIVNHHLYFADLAIGIKTENSLIPEHNCVIFDEAHELEDVATEFFGISLSHYRFEDLTADILREYRSANLPLKEITNAISNLKAKSYDFFDLFQNSPGKYRLKKDNLTEQINLSASDLIKEIDALCQQITPLKGKSEEFERLWERGIELKETLKFILSMEDDRFVYWCDNSRTSPFLVASPLNISELFSELVLQEKSSVVLTSATLSVAGNFDYLKARLGITSCQEISLPSPFDFLNQAIFYIPRHLPDPTEGDFTEKCILEIERILNISQGRAFVLFTSYRALNIAAELLPRALPYKFYVQGEAPKSLLLEKFRETKNAVLLATSSFWQGVDVKGEALSCVIVDKLPFSSPGEPVIEARIERMRKEGADPFREYQLPEAIITLKQGLGRLIRSKTDRGIMSLLDKRIFTRNYGKVILSSLPELKVTSNIEDLKYFL